MCHTFSYETSFQTILFWFVAEKSEKLKVLPLGKAFNFCGFAGQTKI
jgi:hypothetical protein